MRLSSDRSNPISVLERPSFLVRVVSFSICDRPSLDVLSLPLPVVGVALKEEFVVAGLTESTTKRESFRVALRRDATSFPNSFLT